MPFTNRKRKSLYLKPKQQEARLVLKSLRSPKPPYKKKHCWRKIKSDLSNIWSHYCTDTAVVGLRFISGKHPARGLARFIWTVLWLSQVALCCWLSSSLFQRYLLYDIQTSTTYQQQDEISFPAITICNENMFRRSVIGGDMLAMIALSSYYASDMADVPKLVSQNMKTCEKNISTGEKLKINLVELIAKDFIKGMSLIARDSTTDVVNAWWQGTEVNSSKIFYNNPTDDGWCYTFNQDKEQSEESSDTFETFRGYGLTGDDNGIYSTKIAGRQNGLRLLLNVGQHDYCGTGKKYFGAGFYGQIHDPHTQPEFLTSKFILFHPGSSYDIALKPTSFRRDTEHLGLCLNHLYLKMYPSYKAYFQMACWSECATIKVWENCKCFPLNYQGKEKLLAETFNLRENETRICGSDDFSCMHHTVDDTFTQNAKQRCPDCKVACFETFYDYQMTTSKFPSNHFMQRLVNDLMVDNETIRKNYVHVNFYFESMTLIIVDESQAVTPINLMTSFGWTISLFLGSSFLTPFEFIHALISSVVSIVNHLSTFKRVNVISRNVLYTNS